MGGTPILEGGRELRGGNFCSIDHPIVTSDCTIATSEQHLYQTIVQFDNIKVFPRKLAT